MNLKEAVSSLDTMKTVLKQRWAEVLEIDDTFDENESFFDIGGNSMTAGILFSKIESETGVTFRISEIYDHDTVAALASLLLTKMLTGNGVS